MLRLALELQILERSWIRQKVAFQADGRAGGWGCWAVSSFRPRLKLLVALGGIELLAELGVGEVSASPPTELLIPF